MRRSALLLAAPLALLVACSDGGSDAVVVEATPAAIGAAAKSTIDAGTARVEMVIGIDGSAFGIDAPLEIVARGVQDLAGGRSSMTMDMGAMFEAIAGATGEDLPEGFGGELTMAQDGDDMYMCGGFLQLLAQAECIHMNFEELAGTSLSSLTGGGGADPAALMAGLAAISGVEEVGPERVVEVDTTHFSGTITYRQMMEVAGAEQAEALQGMLDQQGLGDDFLDTPLDLDVWIDGEGRVRQMRQHIEQVEVEGVSAGYDIELRFLEFGVPVEIEVPEDFVEASDLPGFGG